MRLVPWVPKNVCRNPLHGIDKLQGDMERVFNDFSSKSNRNMGLLEGNWAPAIDVYDSHDDIMIKADLPGMNKEDIDVTIHGDTLIIKGEKKFENNVKEENYIRSERFYGNFNRTLTLPSEIDHEKVSAKYKDGVLELILSKKEEKKPKRIEVNVK